MKMNGNSLVELKNIHRSCTISSHDLSKWNKTLDM